MTVHGWKVDEWPALVPRVMRTDVRVLCGPADLLGDNGSVTEQLYACSSILYEAGQYRRTTSPTATPRS